MPLLDSSRMLDSSYNFFSFFIFFITDCSFSKDMGSVSILNSSFSIACLILGGGSTMPKDFAIDVFSLLRLSNSFSFRLISLFIVSRLGFSSFTSFVRASLLSLFFLIFFIFSLIWLDNSLFLLSHFSFSLSSSLRVFFNLDISILHLLSSSTSSFWLCFDVMNLIQQLQHSLLFIYPNKAPKPAAAASSLFFSSTAFFFSSTFASAFASWPAAGAAIAT